MLEKQFRAFLRDPATAWEHGARDVAGLQLRLVGGDLAESAPPPIASTGMASGISRLWIVSSTSQWKVLK